MWQETVGGGAQLLDLEIPSNLEELLDLLGLDGDLAQVHELEDGGELAAADPAHEDQRRLVAGAGQHAAEHGAARAQHRAVGLDRGLVISH